MKRRGRHLRLHICLCFPSQVPRSNLLVQGQTIYCSLCDSRRSVSIGCLFLLPSSLSKIRILVYGVNITYDHLRSYRLTITLYSFTKNYIPKILHYDTRTFGQDRRIRGFRGCTPLRSARRWCASGHITTDSLSKIENGDISIASGQLT